MQGREGVGWSTQCGHCHMPPPWHKKGYQTAHSRSCDGVRRVRCTPIRTTRLMWEPPGTRDRAGVGPVWPVPCMPCVALGPRQVCRWPVPGWGGPAARGVVRRAHAPPVPCGWGPRPPVPSAPVGARCAAMPLPPCLTGLCAVVVPPPPVWCASLPKVAAPAVGRDLPRGPPSVGRLPAVPPGHTLAPPPPMWGSVGCRRAHAGGEGRIAASGAVLPPWRPRQPGRADGRSLTRGWVPPSR